MKELKKRMMGPRSEIGWKIMWLKQVPAIWGGKETSWSTSSPVLLVWLLIIQRFCVIRII